MKQSGRPTRLLAFVALVGAFALAAAACSSGGSSEPSGSINPNDVSGTLRLFSYSDGFTPTYMKAFRTQYPKVDLVTSAFGNGDEAVAKMQAGFQADVVNSCVDENTTTMVQDGLYQPLDTCRIPDWKNIFPAMKKLPGVIVDGKVVHDPGGRGHGRHPLQRGRHQDAADLVDGPVQPRLQGTCVRSRTTPPPPSTSARSRPGSAIPST